MKVAEGTYETHLMDKYVLKDSQKRRERERGRKFIQRSKAGNFPNWGKKINIQIQEVLRDLYQDAL